MAQCSAKEGGHAHMAHPQPGTPDGYLASNHGDPMPKFKLNLMVKNNG